MSERTALPTQTKTATPVPYGILQRKCSCGQHASGGECAECQKKKQVLQRKGSGGSPSRVPPVVYDALRSPGQPLDPAVRSFMSSRFGRDFSQVRVHKHARAAASAEAVGAQAYTLGRDIVFGQGRYAPASVAGRRLLAHELTHVVQQAGGAFASGTDLQLGASNDAAEREADRISESIPAGESAVVLQRANGGLQRRPEEGDPLHQPIIEAFRREEGLPSGGVDEEGWPVGPADAEIKYNKKPCDTTGPVKTSFPEHLNQGHNSAGGDFGATRPHYSAIDIKTIVCPDKSDFRVRVKSATSPVDIQTDLQGRTNADSVAPTAANYCAIAQDLEHQAYVKYISASCNLAHERAHKREWEDNWNARFPALQKQLEALKVSASKTISTAAQADVELRPKIKPLVDATVSAARTQWIGEGEGLHGEAAEDACNAAKIKSLCSTAKAGKFPPCAVCK